LVATEAKESHMSVLIKGGRVITAADDYVADIFIEGERISLIGESLDVSADKVIDAEGKYVLPGAVDPHTHLEMPWRGETTIDDFESGHTAAAFGGTTTHVDFCIQGKGQTFGDALEAWHAKREGKALIDNGFHIAVTDLQEGGTLEELARLPEEHGVTSYKLFMAYKDSLMVDDETLFKTMQVAAETGALVMVHAENGDAIEVLMSEAVAAGNVSPRYHALTRPPELEGEATNRAIQLARVAAHGAGLRRGTGHGGGLRRELAARALAIPGARPRSLPCRATAGGHPDAEQPGTDHAHGRCSLDRSGAAGCVVAHLGGPVSGGAHPAPVAGADARAGGLHLRPVAAGRAGF
jgi:hypothetical protein